MTAATYTDLTAMGGSIVKYRIRQEPKGSTNAADKICDKFESVGQRAYEQLKNIGYQPM